MRILFITVLALTLVAPSVEAVEHLDGLAEHLDRCLIAGSTAEVEGLVRALEDNPAAAGQASVIEMLIGVLTARGQEGLAARVRRLSGHVPRAPARRAAIALPADHAAHARAVTEWWYFSGNLTAGGRRLGYQLTFFRTIFGVNMAHVAMTDVTGGLHPFERAYLPAFRCTARRDRLQLEFGKNVAHRDSAGRFVIGLNLHGQRLDLTLTPARAPMLVNANGTIDMPEGGSSSYYSYTRLATTGTLRGRDGRICSVSGLSWFDHQWGDYVVMFRPWDWFSFQMADGSEYNVFHFREAPFSPARTDVNKLTPDGRLVTSHHLAIARRRWWHSPVSGDNFVLNWALHLPQLGETFEVSTPVADQEMPRTGLLDIAPAYWEGLIDVVRRNPDGTIIRGIGYSEHMPYSTRPGARASRRAMPRIVGWSPLPAHGER